MSNAIILYDILLDQGIKKDRAEKAVSAFITRDEVRETPATKNSLRKLTMWIAGMLVDQVAVMTRDITHMPGLLRRI